MTRRSRWFRWLAAAYGTWNVFGAIASVAAGVMWSVRVSREPPSPEPILRGVVYAVIGALAWVAAARNQRGGEKCWWIALGLAVAEWMDGRFRHGALPEDWVELGIVAAVTLLSFYLTGAREPERMESDHAH